MARSLIIIAAICVQLCFVQKLRAHEADSVPLRRLSLSVGEAKSLTIMPADEVKISRKGIVDIVGTDAETIRVMALKPGFVLVKLYYSAPQSRGLDLAIEVKAAAKAQSEQEHKLPAWICTDPNFLCDEEAQVVEGRSSDFRKYLRAKKYCDHKHSCSFEAELSEEGREALKRHYQNILPPRYEADVSPTASLLVVVDCKKAKDDEAEVKAHVTFVSHQTGLSAQKEQIRLICRTKLNDTRYQLQTKLVLSNSMRASEEGFDAKLKAALINGKLDPLARVTNSLRSLLHERKAQIVGESILHVLAGEEVTAKSGGEFLSIVQQEQGNGAFPLKNESWKEYGLVLKAKLSPHGKAEVSLDFDFSLKQPLASQRDMQASSIQARLIGPIDEEFTAGSLSLASQSDANETIPLLAKLPLLGPFFKSLGQQEARAQLYLLVKVIEENKLALSKS